jgi:hypothetical protein
MLDAIAGDPYSYMPTASAASLMHSVVIGGRR